VSILYNTKSICKQLMALVYKSPSPLFGLELLSHGFSRSWTAPSPSRSIYTDLPSPRTQVSCTVYDSWMCSMSPHFRQDILGLFPPDRPSAGDTGACHPNRTGRRYCKTADTGAGLVRPGWDSRPVSVGTLFDVPFSVWCHLWLGR